MQRKNMKNRPTGDHTPQGTPIEAAKIADCQKGRKKFEILMPRIL